MKKYETIWHNTNTYETIWTTNTNEQNYEQLRQPHETIGQIFEIILIKQYEQHIFIYVLYEKHYLKTKTMKRYKHMTQIWNAYEHNY